MDRSAVHRIRSSLRPVLSWLDPWSRRGHAQHVSPQDAPPVVGVIDPDPVARNGLRTLLHGLGIDVSTSTAPRATCSRRTDATSAA